MFTVARILVIFAILDAIGGLALYYMYSTPRANVVAIELPVAIESEPVAYELEERTITCQRIGFWVAGIAIMLSIGAYGMTEADRAFKRSADEKWNITHARMCHQFVADGSAYLQRRTEEMSGARSD